MITGQSNLQQLIDEIPTIRPSIRTFNLLSREHVHTVAQLLDLTPGTVETWRNRNSRPDGTWLDIETLQTAVGKMLDRVRVDPVRRPTVETHTAFAIRAIQWETWWKAHDSICPSYLDCHIHDNPHQEP